MSVRFSRLHPDGTETKVRIVETAAIQRCRFLIFNPEHYRADGTCRCDDADHREFMISAWQYKPEHFGGIPLRPDPFQEIP